MGTITSLVKESEVRKVAEGKEFTAATGRRWRVGYTQAGVKGMIKMRQIVFEALDGELAGEERYLTVHPGFLEGADEHQLEVALSQAQRVSAPW